MTSEEAIKALLEILKAHESRSDSFGAELDDIHAEWQRDRGIHIRLEAQIEALLSLVAELASQSKVSKEHVEACFRERVRYFQDKKLVQLENASPNLAGQIDNRAESEIPTHQGFRPLFPED